MKGSHQVGNAALALMAVMYVKHTYHFNWGRRNKNWITGSVLGRAL